MAFVTIPKDLTRVQTKFMFGLTKRQTICFGSGAAIGVPLYFILRSVIPLSTAAFVMVLIMLPFFLLAIFEIHGQPLEVVARNIIRTMFIRPKLRPYQTDNLYAATGRQAKLYREVKNIVTNRKTARRG